MSVKRGDQLLLFGYTLVWLLAVQIAQFCSESCIPLLFSHRDNLSGILNRSLKEHPLFLPFSVGLHVALERSYGSFLCLVLLCRQMSSVFV